MHNYLPLSTLSWIIAILIAFYGSHVNDVTRLPASNKSRTTRRDVVKFSPVPIPTRILPYVSRTSDRSVWFARWRTGAQSISSRFQVSPRAKLIFQNFSWLTRSRGGRRGEEREKIGSTPARESFYGASLEPRPNLQVGVGKNTLDIQKAARQSLRQSRCAGFGLAKSVSVTPVERIVAQVSTAGARTWLYEISMAVIGLNLFMYDLN